MLFGRFWPEVSRKQANIKGKVSTIGSDEDLPYPGPTLSFCIVRFDPFWPEIENLALNTRLNGLISLNTGTAGPKVVA